MWASEIRSRTVIRRFLDILDTTVIIAVGQMDILRALEQFHSLHHPALNRHLRTCAAEGRAPL